MPAEGRYADKFRCVNRQGRLAHGETRMFGARMVLERKIAQYAQRALTDNGLFSGARLALMVGHIQMKDRHTRGCSSQNERGLDTPWVNPRHKPSLARSYMCIGLGASSSDEPALPTFGCEGACS